MLSINTDEVVTHNIAEFAAQVGIPPARMNRQERLQLITRLEGSGDWLGRHGCPDSRDLLTQVYRYLHTIRSTASGPDQNTSARSTQL